MECSVLVTAVVGVGGRAPNPDCEDGRGGAFDAAGGKGWNNKGAADCLFGVELEVAVAVEVAAAAEVGGILGKKMDCPFAAAAPAAVPAFRVV